MKLKKYTQYQKDGGKEVVTFERKNNIYTADYINGLGTRQRLGILNLFEFIDAQNCLIVDGFKEVK